MTGSRELALVLFSDGLEARRLGAMLVERGIDARSGIVLADFQPEHVDAASMAFVEVSDVSPAGLASIAGLRRRGFSGPLFVVSPDDHEAYRARGFRAGANDYLSLPIKQIDVAMRLAAIPLPTFEDSVDLPIGEEGFPCEGCTQLQGELVRAHGDAQAARQRAHEAESRAEELAARLARLARSRASSAPPIVTAEGPASVPASVRGHVDREYARSTRYGHPVSVLTFDPGGAEQTRLMIALRPLVRLPDVVARLGARVVIVASDTDREMASRFAERLLESLREEFGALRVGLACSQDTQVRSAGDLLNASDPS